MALSHALAARSSSPRSPLNALLFAFVVTSSFARADLPAPGVASAPPDFPDTVHLENGCYLSALVYIAQFTAAFPGERAAPLTVRPRNFDEPHTIALLSWNGRWWGRDEYCGVFEIRSSVGNGVITASVKKMAETALGYRASQLARQGRVTIAPPTPPDLPVALRARDVALARMLLPLATEQFWIRSAGREIPVLFFRPTAERVAVYDPQNGTATAETANTDAAEIVALVAARLGYRSESVHREPLVLPPVLIASHASSPPVLSR